MIEFFSNNFLEITIGSVIFYLVVLLIEKIVTSRQLKKVEKYRKEVAEKNETIKTDVSI